MPMGEPGKTGRHDDAGSPASSFNRLCEDLVRQLECPSGDEEMYTPTDKRNSFIEQFVQFGPVLKEDAPMQGAEGPNGGPPSYLAQKRRSSFSELTAFFQDLVDDGESNRTILPNENNNTEKDAKAVAGEPHHPHMINNIMATPSTEQVMGQAEGEGGGGGRGDGEDGPDKGVQRASVYLLMHAMAAVDAASDEANDDGVKNHARL